MVTYTMPDNTPDEFEAFSSALDRMLNSHSGGIPQRGSRPAGGGPRHAYQGDRDLWNALGYPSDRQLDYGDYKSWYERGDIATPIIEKPPSTTWKEPPGVTDRDVEDSTEDDETTGFEDDVQTLFDADADTGPARGLRHYLRRADLLGRIGEYSVLFIGLADVDSAAGLAEPVNRQRISGPDDLLFLTPLGQGDADIEMYVEDVTNPRNGLPELYDLELANGDETQHVDVHHERVLHVAEGVVDDEIHGEPAIRAVINRLIDIQKISGAAAEAFWRVSNPGLALSVDSDFQDVDTDKMDEQVDEWEHKLSRVLKLYGTDVEQLDTEDVNPEPAMDAIVKLIAGGVGIPQRKLVGSERGELASSMDEASYLGMISERQTDFAEPVILRPFIDRLVEFGVLSPPQGGDYVVQWPDLFELTELEQSEAKKTDAEAAAALAPMGDISALHSVEALQQFSPVEEPDEATPPQDVADPDEDIDEEDEQVVEQFEQMVGEGAEADD